MRYWYVKNGVIDRQPTCPQPDLPTGVDAVISDVTVVAGRVKVSVFFSNQEALEFEFDSSVPTLIEDIESSIQYHTDLL